MKPWKRLGAGVLSVVLLVCPSRLVAAENQKAEPGKQQPQKFERTIKVTLDDPELYKWLLQQKRTPRKPEGAKK